MKLITVIFLSILIAGNTLTIEQDKWNSDQYIIKDSDNEKKGIIKKDPWSSKPKWNIYDDKKNKTGIIKQDPWNKNKYKIEKKK